MTTYYRLDTRRNLQLFIFSDKKWTEIHEKLMDMDCDFPHLYLTNYLDHPEVWTLEAINCENLPSDEEVIENSVPWSVAQAALNEQLKHHNFDAMVPGEPKRLDMIQQMQDVIDSGTVISHQGDFIYDINSLSRWSETSPLFVWIAYESGTSMHWLFDRLKERYSALQCITAMERDRPKGRVFIGHLEANTFQEVSYEEAKLSIPIDPVELQAYLDYKPTLDEFLANPEYVMEHLENVRAIAKDLGLEENLERCVQRVVEIAYQSEVKLFLWREGDRSFYWEIRKPGSNSRVMNGGINYYETSTDKGWTVNT